MPFCLNCLQDIPSYECHFPCIQHQFSIEASRLRARVAELEGALNLIATFPPEGYHRRTDEGYPSEVVYDRFAYERMIDTYREVATTALKG